jgi:hypothetical protein
MYIQTFTTTLINQILKMYIQTVTINLSLHTKDKMYIQTVTITLTHHTS